jgi:RNA polymerase sigma factor (sigma-70 family)
VRARSREEFEALFRAHYASVFGSVLLIVHDRGRAEEVTQDAFLKLYERWTAVNWVVENPPAWVHQVAVRAAIRRAQREKVVPVAEPVERATADQVPDVDLVNAIAHLAPKQRAAVVLFYLEDRPVEEIARVMGTSTSTVKQHLHRARARLAEVLQEEEEAVDDVS